MARAFAPPDEIPLERHRAAAIAAGEFSLGTDEAEYPPARYAWYVVFILMLANVSSYVDRQILSYLVEPIKRDLAISDTQIGYLMGVSFALFYTVLGFPIGRLADRRSRRGIIGWGIAVWSVMTVLFGLGRTYTHLLLARVGVGVGEAALAPPALSLIADLFPPNRQATAVSIYGIGIYLGSGLAYFIGGMVVQLVSGVDAWSFPLIGAIRPWQTVFLLIGLPGLLIAGLMLTVREPRRRGTTRSGEAVPLREIARYLRQHFRTFGPYTFGYAFFTMVNIGTAAWLPTYLIRVHEWTPGKAGLYMGSATMIFGVAGIVLGGRLADRLLRRGYADAKLRVGVIAAIGALASAIPLYLTRNEGWVIVLLIPLNIFSAFPFGAAQAALQEITPSPMRAQVTALYFFVNSLVGTALGPVVVAAATDNIFRDDAAVGNSILLVAALGHLTVITLLTLGGRSYRQTAEASAAWDREHVLAL